MPSTKSKCEWKSHFINCLPDTASWSNFQTQLPDTASWYSLQILNPYTSPRYRFQIELPATDIWYSSGYRFLTQVLKQRLDTDSRYNLTTRLLDTASWSSFLIQLPDIASLYIVHILLPDIQLHDTVSWYSWQIQLLIQLPYAAPDTASHIYRYSFCIQALVQPRDIASWYSFGDNFANESLHDPDMSRPFQYICPFFQSYFNKYLTQFPC